MYPLVCPLRVRVSLPVAASHTFSVLSSLPLTIRLPSGLKATLVTQWRYVPLRVRISLGRWPHPRPLPSVPLAAGQVFAVGAEGDRCDALTVFETGVTQDEQRFCLLFLGIFVGSRNFTLLDICRRSFSKCEDLYGFCASRFVTWSPEQPSGTMVNRTMTATSAIALPSRDVKS